MTDRLRLVRPAESRRLHRAFATSLHAEGASDPRLRAVVADVLIHPGSLVRAQLAFGLGLRLGVAATAALRLATAVEYFHTASLIFDDLPAMDDASERRGRPCPHRVHGEAAATLGALAFITRGYALLWEGIGALPPRRRDRISTVVAEGLGLLGILDGQARDVHFVARASDREEMLRIEAAKTAPLLRLALLLPAIAAGEEELVLHRLSRLAEGWGLAYQLLDDFKDDLLSQGESGKTPRRDRALGRPSLAVRAGHRAARERLASELATTRAELMALEADRAESWEPLRRLQGHLEQAEQQVTERLELRRSA